MASTQSTAYRNQDRGYILHNTRAERFRSAPTPQRKVLQIVVDNQKEEDRNLKRYQGPQRLRDDVHALREEHRELKEMFKYMVHEVGGLKEELGELKEENQNLRSEMDDLKASTKKRRTHGMNLRRRKNHQNSTPAVEAPVESQTSSKSQKRRKRKDLSFFKYS